MSGERGWWLSVERCEAHGALSVTINHGATGTRLTPDKCCGRWVVLKDWSLSAKQLRDIAEEMMCEAMDAEQAEESSHG